MTYELQVLNYEAPELGERFDQLIVQTLVAQDPRLAVHVVHSPGAFGTVILRCGAQFTSLLGDCYVIENLEHGTFKVVDYQDADASPAVQLASSPYFRGALYTMYHPPRISRLFGAKQHMVQPGWFLDQYPRMTRSFRSLVRDRRRQPLDPRLLFRGTILTHNGDNKTAYAWQGKPFRQVAEVLRAKYPNEVDVSDQKLPREGWFLKAAEHEMVLTLPGHPWCYREFELLSLGIPLVAYPWHLHVNAGALPIPGVHYIATSDLKREEPGFAIDPEEGADRIIEAYRTARMFPKHTEEVGRAGQQWYDWALDPEVIAAGTLRFLNLDGPEWIADQPAAGPLPRHQMMEAS